MSDRSETQAQISPDALRALSALRTELRSVLRSQFKHDDFRGDQEAILERACTGGSALVLMPTGMGKSLCYQMPAKILKADRHLVLVISPLIALMQDQVEKARQNGIDAVAINSSLTSEQKEHRLSRLGAGRYELLFVTPERFRKPEFCEIMATRKVSLLAVDEAHCISQWGHDFRPDYSKLGEIRASLGDPPVLALTATATPDVQKDIMSSLRLEGPIFSSGIERPNLNLSVHSVYEMDEKVRSVVGLRYQFPGPAIIYFSLIQTLYKMSEHLERLQIPHLVYHGQLPSGVRSSVQKKFIESKDEMILATPAFGLGIDKENVRLLLHAELPGSIEAYFQEIGRAGRDGKPAEAHLLFDRDDVTIAQEFIKWANPGEAFVEQVFRLIQSGGPKLHTEGLEFLRRQMNFYNSRDFRVETSLNLLERLDAIEPDKSRLGFAAVREPSTEEIRLVAVASRKENQDRKLRQMLTFAELEQGCRMTFIRQYFGTMKESDVPCGHCDLCAKRGLP